MEITIHIKQLSTKGKEKKHASKSHPYNDKSNNKEPEQVRAHCTQSEIWVKLVNRSQLKSRAGWLVLVLGKAANQRE